MKKKTFELMAAACIKAGVTVSSIDHEDQKIFTKTGRFTFNPVAYRDDFTSLLVKAGGKAYTVGQEMNHDTQSRARWMNLYVAGAFDVPWAVGGTTENTANKSQEVRVVLPPASPGVHYNPEPNELPKAPPWSRNPFPSEVFEMDFSEIEQHVIAYYTCEHTQVEKEKETMTISNKELNGMVNLMYGAMTIVKVRFKSDYGQGLSTKQYSYKFDGKKIEVGDEVVVESPHNGYVVVVVEEVEFNQVKGIDDEMSLKWVVCKVTDRAYKARCEREQAVKAMIKDDFNRMRGQKALDHLRTALGNDVDIDTYADILRNKKTV